MRNKEIIKKYLENGFGYNCNTSEFKDLQIKFKQDDEMHIKNLEYFETRKKELYNTEIDVSALDVVKADLRDKEINKINKEINLIIIALRYYNFEQFIIDCTR